MGIYTPLEVYLTKLRLEGRNEVVLTFQEIEILLGAELPPRAKEGPGPQWWGNENPQTTRHTQCKAWQNAGWKANPDLAAKRVKFVRDQSFG